MLFLFKLNLEFVNYRRARALLASSLFLLAAKKDYYRVISGEQFGLHCRSYCGCSHFMQGVYFTSQSSYIFPDSSRNLPLTGRAALAEAFDVITLEDSKHSEETLM